MEFLLIAAGVILLGYIAYTKKVKKPSKPKSDNNTKTADLTNPTEDWEWYLKNYADVAAGGLTKQWAEKHYNNWGKREGRTWGKMEEGTGDLYYSHWNSSAWHDEGVALILGPGEHLKWVKINGVPLTKHGNGDKGREAWAIYNSRSNPGGVLTGETTENSKNPNMRFSFNVASSGVQDGPARGDYGDWTG